MPLDVFSTIPFGAILILVLGTIFWIFHKNDLDTAKYTDALAAYGFICMLAALICKAEMFDLMRLLCIAIFYGGTILLLGLAFIAFKKKRKPISIIFSVLALLIVSIGIDAFLLEPTWLESKFIEIESDKISKPIKIAVLSDLQTDKIGDYERMALQRVLDQKPDIILLPGDYVQANSAVDLQAYEEEIKRLNSLLAEIKFSAKSGTFAVRGNVEDRDWTRIFKNLPIKPYIQTGSEPAGEAVVTGLSFEDSFNPNMKVAAKNQFHIVFGHGPDFSLGKIDADLLVAGHTHGGQVQIPGFGALITFSTVPRRWGTGGFFEIHPGSHLLVTTGVGHERYHAPRLRFFCHPEIVFITVKPHAESSPPASKKS